MGFGDCIGLWFPLREEESMEVRLALLGGLTEGVAGVGCFWKGQAHTPCRTHSSTVTSTARTRMRSTTTNPTVVPMDVSEVPPVPVGEASVVASVLSPSSSRIDTPSKEERTYEHQGHSHALKNLAVLMINKCSVI